MSRFADQLAQLSPQKLALLAVELQARLDKAQQVAREAREPIAVTGMGCRFAGGVATPEGFWSLLERGGIAAREIPPERWEVERYFDPDPDAPARMTTRFGGFLDDITAFDAQFFGTSPREAVRMDPQQRLVLE
ncbi:MAG: beta-ketoacyl synthase N-terminal-like domain-containing protein, partial [Chloroflexota bacterium]